MEGKQVEEPLIPPFVYATLAAWVLPGLGHILLGHTRRGVILLISLTSLYVSGLLIGGLSVIDSISIEGAEGGRVAKQNNLWYYGQVMFNPVTLAINSWHQGQKLDRDGRQGRPESLLPPQPGRDGKPAAYEPSLGRVNELGTLYCTLAGVLNLLAIIDLIGRSSAPAPAVAGRGRIVQREGVA